MELFIFKLKKKDMHNKALVFVNIQKQKGSYAKIFPCEQIKLCIY